MSFEDRQDLLGHTAGRITTHYSGSEIASLIKAANKVCEYTSVSPTVNLVRRDAQLVTRKRPAEHEIKEMVA